VPRLVTAFLPLAGALGMALAVADPVQAPLLGVWEPAIGWAALQHRQLMLALLAASLLATPWLPAIRLPAIAASVLAKASYLAVALLGTAAVPPLAWADAALMAALAVAGLVLFHEARLEARWDGVLPLHQQS
jgi:hypothetical protein